MPSHGRSYSKKHVNKKRGKKRSSKTLRGVTKRKGLYFQGGGKF